MCVTYPYIHHSCYIYIYFQIIISIHICMASCLCTCRIVPLIIHMYIQIYISDITIIMLYDYKCMYDCIILFIYPRHVVYMAVIYACIVGSSLPNREIMEMKAHVTRWRQTFTYARRSTYAMSIDVRFSAIFHGLMAVKKAYFLVYKSSIT